MIRGLWDREMVALLLVCAILPVAVTWLLTNGWPAATRLLLCALCIGAWQLVWMLARAQPPSTAALITAIAVAILAPENLGLLPLLLGVSFGIVFAELAFGGWGRNILNPATVALAFLGFGFPAFPWPEVPIQLGWAAIPAVLIAVVFGIARIRMVLGAVLIFALTIYVFPDVSTIWPAVLVVFALLVMDPVASASTPPGAWVNGALYAGLVVLFHATMDAATPAQIAVSAALLVSLAVPLVDEIAVALWVYGRRRKLG
ncbi:Na+-transporting NADH:ubiquinone oxidoreductase subunit B [Jannaschia faecimaris]|uniref:Na+-transporting NADH:ubiquinone oxidoreductase subunit B n=1 Tax=Jannaschia faecimaris TaxID=1244108 RepID=A0A1H3SAW5_9RHOB|nr:RnfABCDGE type electron transport complex subunit D [Jannaschia faecimaris]SDZ34695.1 Na+-transporting NADH:ubiquinone oxidoreductase subunit B [Jannaschia faecimaris]